MARTVLQYAIIIQTPTKVMITTPSKIHIIGIAGKTSSALAHTFKKMGWEVTGSDQGIYPPVSDFLRENNIEVRTPYDEQNLPDDIDIVVVAGNALIVDPQNPEYLKAQRLQKRILNYPQVLAEYVVKKNSIVVAGNFGKGTISGALVKALHELKQNPSYMVGGEMIDFEDSLQITEGNWSVMEGDEYPTPPIDNEPAKSKIFYYNPKYLVLTSAEWDHYDMFPSEEAYVENYRLIISQLPTDGILLANLDGKNIDQLIHNAPCRVVTYSHDNKQADYVTNTLQFDTPLFGRFNLSNLTAVYALLVELGFDQHTVREALSQYHGLVYRMQVVYQDSDRVIIRDLAHSPVKAQTALEAVRERWPGHICVGVFEIFSSSLKNKAVLKELTGRFDAVDTVIIPKVDQVERIAKSKRVTGKEIVAAIGSNARYMPKDDAIVDHLTSLPPKSVVIFMSSGGLRGIPEKYLATL